ncbi:nuclear pore complex assembly-domain-containing protein [Xylariaceae sp. FL0804]|nr:nuclear pore complex assembly-domain-containing protein [Xylariaceae sp. FL0804]
MVDFSDFDRLFGSMSPFPYNKASVQKIESCRRELDGTLFIDRVLKALNLSQATAHYPPKNEKALRQLHQQICESPNITVHHKLSVFYYLLLDIDNSSAAGAGGSSDGANKSIGSSRRRADSFAAGAGVPDRYQIFMQGLWHMDARSFGAALTHLTHPCLLPDFADDIIEVLVRHAARSPSSGDSDGDGGGDADYSLPLAYYHAAQPVLRSPRALAALFDALARSSVAEAFAFARARADVERRALFQRLVTTVVGGSSSSGGGGGKGPEAESKASRDGNNGGGGERAAARAFELASLPLDADEERWFRECLEAGPGKRLRAARDTLLMRRIATGEAPRAGEKGTWGVVLEGFKTGSGGRALS